MISPISTISFKGPDKVMGAVNTTQKALSSLAMLDETKDEFKRNLETDKEAYSQALQDVAQKAEDNKLLKPIADAANSKVGRKIADILGGFTAFCTSLTGAATAVATTGFMLG